MGYVDRGNRCLGNFLMGNQRAEHMWGRARFCSGHPELMLLLRCCVVLVHEVGPWRMFAVLVPPVSMQLRSVVQATRQACTDCSGTSATFNAACKLHLLSVTWTQFVRPMK